MSTHLLLLAEAAAAGRDVVGGKAWTLAELARLGFPVPGGFVVPADADPSPKELRSAIDALDSGRFAVRSSAVAEDLAEASYAGLYESYLNVRAADVADAVRRCRASAQAERITGYHHRRADPGVAVLVQPMIDAEAAGVAFTANPVTGARDEVVITAVRGLGEALVSGEAVGEEWLIQQGRARLSRGGGVLESPQAQAVAELAQRVQERFGVPQDIEWAIEADRLHLLQARPMTALPDPVAWDPPGSGIWLRNFRLGEWLSDPVTPLFADWLLARIDEGFLQGMRDTAGAAVPFPHAVVNGWYYTQPNPSPRKLPGALIRSRGWLLPFMFNALIQPGRDPAAADRAVLGHLHRQWRDTALPAYRELTTQFHGDLPTAQLIRLIDAIGRTAGLHLWYLTIVGGAAWKMEACLARFLERHGQAGPQPLLRGLPGIDRTVPDHAVHSIDWYHPTAGETGPLPGPAPTDALKRQRIQAEQAYRDRLPRRSLAAFTAMLQTAQHYAVIREQQARDLTLGWPVLRACLRCIGRHLADDGIIDQPDDVFFLTRAELEAAQPQTVQTRRRRSEWQKQRRLTSPLCIGSPPPIIGRHLQHTLGLVYGARTDGALTGQAASTGRATGAVRIVRDHDDFARVRPGDVLVARATAPAWTPLFARVAAVVTDGGTLAAHASLIAREYGIPAVVATGDATVRLHDGQVVTVDGGRGVVEM
jgi:pyruvate,water dikinase